MAEFQWWVLIVGLVVGGSVVGFLTASFSRHDVDLESDERAAEATFIASHLASTGLAVDPPTVDRILEAHRQYLALPAPLAIVPADGSAGDRHPDDEADEVGHGGGGGADRDLPSA
ncbi:MAG TPA: hypothetical protein VET90_08380 [Candidatus Binatus sp.]|nr:hypothetical protein [Candidatus Binatus sp.]